MSRKKAPVASITVSFPVPDFKIWFSYIQSSSLTYAQYQTTLAPHLGGGQNTLAMRQVDSFSPGKMGGFAVNGPTLAPSRVSVINNPGGQGNLPPRLIHTYDIPAQVPELDQTILWLSIPWPLSGNPHYKLRGAMTFIRSATVQLARKTISYGSNSLQKVHLELCGCEVRSTSGLLESPPGDYELDVSFTGNAFWRIGKDVADYMASLGTNITTGHLAGQINLGALPVSGASHDSLERSMHRARLGPPIAPGVYWGDNIAGVRFVVDDDGNKHTLEHLMDHVGSSAKLMAGQDSLLAELRSQEERLRGAAYLIKLLRERLEEENPAGE